MYYSDEIIEEVRSKNDIVDVISGYVKLKKQGSSYFGLCPFHSEKSPSFSVSRDKQMYYCFGCGAGGNVFTFIMEYENYSFVEALKFLAQRAGVELPQEEYSKEAKERADTRSALLEMNKLAAKYYYAQLKTEGGRQAREYLQNRQLSQETITAFGLGYSSKYSDDLFRYLKMKGYSEEMIIKAGLVNVDEKHGVYDKFWNRVMFPIMDVNNRVIGFGGRVMGDGKPKYLNSPETLIFDKSRNLYGLHRARTSRKPYFIVCEGYMDVISLHQAGFTNAVASLGTALTAGHAALIKRYVNEVYLTYDSENETVAIPNKEVSQEYINAISTMGWHEVMDAVQASRKLLQALWNMDADTVAQGIEQAHQEISILQYNDENALSCTINLALYFARKYYTIIRELPTGKGYADICYIPRKLYADKPAIVVELKWDKTAEGAIAQIKEKQYVNALKEYRGNLLLAGINYDRETKKHYCIIEKLIME